MLTIEAKLITLVRGLGGRANQRIDPRQFLGLEKNVQAAKITELVLWIGWLRQRMADPEREIPDPVLATLKTINFGNLDSFDSVVRRKIEMVPETGLSYLGEPDTDDPGPPDWPEADYIVGNPPFIGGKDIRAELGAEEAEAVWRANPDVPPSADLVMHWWNQAAKILTAPGTRLKRFGFVTTNSITQVFSRRVIAQYLSPAPEGEGLSGKLSILMAIPNHPWVKLAREEKIKGFRRKGEQALKQPKKAAVRIAMTVAEAGAGKIGRLFEVKSEAKLASDAPEIEFYDPDGTDGIINSDLSIGADVASAVPLLANEGLAHRGMQLIGAGFIVTPVEAKALKLGERPGLEAHIRPYRNGRDLMQRSRDALVIDLYGLSEEEVSDRFPEVYDHVHEFVKSPRLNEKTGQMEGRDLNARKTYRENWWIFGEPRGDLRPALQGLERYIATVETAKHRIFQFLDAAILPDNKLILTGSDDAFHLGVLSSRIHTDWALRAGGWLGAGNDPVYVKSKVFDPFPFPDATPALREAITELAERLDRQRKEALAETPNLTMTEIYNLRSRLKDGSELNDDEKQRMRPARTRIVDELHGKLDAAVAEAYGWEADLAPAEIVARLVALNAERAVEEKAGKVRWLRRDYQEPRFGKKENPE